MPFDKAAIFTSVEKTSRVLIVHEDVKTLGIGAELSAVIVEERFEHLDAPVLRVTYPDTHCPFSHVLESFNLPERRQDRGRASPPGRVLAAGRPPPTGHPIQTTHSAVVPGAAECRTPWMRWMMKRLLAAFFVAVVFLWWPASAAAHEIGKTQVTAVFDTAHGTYQLDVVVDPDALLTRLEILSSGMSRLRRTVKRAIARLFRSFRHSWRPFT